MKRLRGGARATTRGSRRQALTARLRAIAGLPARCTCDENDMDGGHDVECPLFQPPRTRLRTASFEHSHRVWTPPDPPRRWFEDQGITPASREINSKRWDKWLGGF